MYINSSDDLARFSSTSVHGIWCSMMYTRSRWMERKMVGHLCQLALEEVTGNNDISWLQLQAYYSAWTYSSILFSWLASYEFESYIDPVKSRMIGNIICAILISKNIDQIEKKLIEKPSFFLLYSYYRKARNHTNINRNQFLCIYLKRISDPQQHTALNSWRCMCASFGRTAKEMGSMK